MNCFGELFARYQYRVMDLCYEECMDAGRLYCSVNDEPPWNDVCVMCERTSYDDGHQYSEVCDGPCRDLYAWINAATNDGGYKRRRMLKLHFGTSYIRVIDKPMRREAILTTMLLIEAGEKAHAAKKRQRVVA